MLYAGIKNCKMLLLLSFLLCAGIVSAQQQVIQLPTGKVSIQRIFQEIEKQTNLSIDYNQSRFNNSRQVEIQTPSRRLADILQEILQDTDLEYTIQNGHVIIKQKQETGQGPSTARRRVTGVISDPSGEPIIGANIIVKGTTTGTVSDFDGRFDMDVPANSILKISYIGYVEQEIRIAAGKENYLVQLKEDSEMLDEVVVVGYGVQKKKLVTGASVQVKGEDIQKLNTVNALGALQSQTPGVNITQMSGMPGEGFKVTIRGLGTVGSSSPLYIIDGVTGGDINDLNPADIQSIDVLKDAASAAIYGARAANGVILITTKQGRIGKATVTLDAYFGLQNPYKMPDILGPQDYAMLQNEGRTNDGLDPYDFASLVPDWDRIQNGWEGPQWLKSIRNKNAPTQNYALNISGGTEQSVYSVGVSYTSQEGIFGKPVVPDFQRITTRVNTEYILYKKNNLDVIKVGENITYTYREKTGISITDRYNNNINSMIKASPFMPVYDSEGDYHASIPWDIREANPIGVMDYTSGQNLTKNNNLKANGYIEIQPVSKLKIRSNFGFTNSSKSYRKFIPEFYLSTITFRNENTVEQEMSVGNRWLWENTINYNFTLNSQHNFDVLVGQSMEKNGLGESMKGKNVNSIFDDFEHAYLDNTKTIYADKTSLSGFPWGKHRLASFFGRVNYDWKETYMATLVMRADGSSNFSRGNRWGYFPSVSAGWVMTNESWMEPVTSVMDFMKLRASWGQNGNQEIDNFQYLSTIAFNTSYFWGPDKQTEIVGAYPDILSNPDVKWETSEQYDFGLDARFFGGRLGFAFDYYIKNTKDWLVRAPVLDTYGTGAPYINGGDVRNSGVEIAFNWNDQAGDFRYGVNLNLTHNKNEVTRIANSEGIIHGDANVLSEGTSEMYRAQVGYPIGYFYGYKTAGIFQTEAEIENYKGAKYPNTVPGGLIYVDVDGDGEITEEDRTMIGNPHPKLNMGLSLNFEYKGFDLLISTMGSFGHQIARSYRSFADNPKENWTADIFDRWHGEGTSNKIPRLTSGTHSNWRNISDIFIENADYFRIQNVTLGYDFKKLFPAMLLGQARLYVTAQNLWTITGYSGMDPEIGYGYGKDWVSGIDLGFYPAPRTFLIGVNLKF